MEHMYRFLSEESGNAAVEYAVLLGLIVLLAVGSIVALGQRISTVFSSLMDVGPSGSGPSGAKSALSRATASAFR